MPLNSFFIISRALSPPPPPPISSFHKPKTPHTPTVPCHLQTPLAAMPTFRKQMATASTTAFSNHLQTPLAVTPNFDKQSAATTTTTTLLNHLQTPRAVMPTFHKQKVAASTTLLSILASIAILLSLNSPFPSLASPSLNPLLPSTTPFSQSQNLPFGLEDGKIRPCPSTNPSCVSTNPKSSSFGFPWMIPENDRVNPVQKLKDAVLKTQKNAEIQVIEDTPDGQYLQVEVDGGGFGRDVLEFLIKKDVVVYRSLAKKVTYVYPFTTALGDSKGQKERVKKILEQVGWYEPGFDYMD